MESTPAHNPKDLLPQPRKQPVQARSRAMVDAVAEACLRILEKEGEDALTVNRIAEVSGATSGSIYQYFPNKESMIAAVYERLLNQESEQLYRMREQLHGLPLQAVLCQVFSNMIRVELRLHSLSSGFHARYRTALHLGQWHAPQSSPQEFINTTWLPLLEIHASEVQTEHRALAAYLMGKGLREIIHSAVQDVPEQAQSAEFLDALVAMAMSCTKGRQP
ncbi:TetR/AcrR family transcriptional regulator [Comamonas sp. Y33R10-2]|uniref:TetR/AcrR family transcriptional regulator n=1 Tax=Comamonas sp. Y33R10-2 TaxID=2853257 RepID=UPI001C5CA322|nr:TetR/AcrR family transcriptional regulator [Comamonas sp. Y33R10-2]QXZ09784.1 TetR/AcrR family transcriptional regulator [Comamonas sp. Y33R10-2]